MKSPLKKTQGYTTIELLVFLLAITGIVAWSISPIQKQMKNMEGARTNAAEAEISFRKERYLFESNPQKIDEFNQSGDEIRWQILSEKTRRGDNIVKDPLAFIRFSGKSSIFIGRDAEEVRISP